MKKVMLFVVASISLMLAACGEDSDVATVEKEVAEATQTETANAEQPENDTKATEEKKEENKDEVANNLAHGENILKENIVFEYEDGDVVMTIDHAEFTKEVATSTGASPRNIISDKEIFLHLTGTISNDTMEAFQYGHQLAGVKFKAIYDNKHEFDFLADTESLDGSKFQGASIDPLEEQKIHIYAQVPLAIAQPDKSLTLIVLDSEGEHEVFIR
ncbi:hypothetical protein SAMN05518871_11128 [Psychrobacillus sp. OK028]|uniref:hypothetical protein n=1 Tax=Psychrobacillus sp. OK028 TaxID=1884359 RepID=UPI00088AFE31|nr:hypothetical protein [Psychrobacillus sp. OK028]SDO15137.1 hypothetical protein SAMN05518871_11128 [Psychrobacillus sp. OK028]